MRRADLSSMTGFDFVVTGFVAVNLSCLRSTAIIDDYEYSSYFPVTA